MKPSVMLDPGHGGEDSGALGPAGLREKDVALSVALLLGALLTQGGVDVFYTRKDDTFVPLAERARRGNEKGVDLFLSIHCNSAERPATGFEVFTTPGKTRSDDAATECFKAFGEEFPQAARRMDSSDGDADKEANFAVLRLSSGPAVLFELEFIHTAEGEAFLRNPVNQSKCAKALGLAVLRFLFPLRPATSVAVAPAAPAQASVKDKLLELSAELLTQANRL